MLEKDEIQTALCRANGNIRIATDHLGASRKTVYNRMRQYGMPHGRSGRPRRELAYHDNGGAGALLGMAALAGAGYLLARWIKSPHVAGDDSSSPYLVGAYILGAY